MSEIFADAKAKAPKPAVVGFDPVLSVEEVSARTETAKVFKNADGTRTVQAATAPVHFKDAAGGWSDIDSRVVSDPANPGGLRSAANAWTAKFGSSADGVGFESPDGKFSMRVLGGAKVAPQLVTGDTSSVVYPNVFPNVDLKYTVTAVGIKESVIVKVKAVLPAWVFAVDGVEVQADAAAPGAFRPKGALSNLKLEPLVVVTADGREVTTDAAASIAIKTGVPTPGVPGSLLAVGLNPVWLLSQPVSAFPLVVDPSVTVGQATAYQYQSYSNRGGQCVLVGLCSSAALLVGTQGISQLTIWRSAVAFNYAAFLPTASVYSKLQGASLNVTWQNGYALSGTSQPIAVRHATGFSYCGVAVTQTQPCTDYTPLIGGGVQNLTPHSVLSYNVLGDLTPWWFAGAPSYGFALSSNEPTNVLTWQQLSVTLSLTYDRLPIPVQAGSTPAAGTPAHSYLNGLAFSTPALSDPDGEQLYYDFVMCQGAWAPTGESVPTCTRRVDSGWITSNTWTAYSPGSAGFPGSFYQAGPMTWGVFVTNQPGGGGLVYTPPWSNSWQATNGAAAPPTLSSPADGFRWSPNAPVTLTANQTSDPEGDALEYRFVIREKGAAGISTKSAWIPAPAGSTVSYLIPPNAPLQPGLVYEWSVEVHDEITRFFYYLYQDQAQGGPSLARTAKFEQRLGSSGPSPFQSYGPITANLATGNVVTSVSSTGFNTVGGSLGASFVYNSQAKDKGLRGRYYNDTNLSGTLDAADALVADRVDAAPNFDWGTSASVAGGSVDNFSVRWNGFITPDVSGTYRFRMGADDRTSVVVNGATVLTTTAPIPSTAPTSYGDYESRFAATVSSTTIALTAGVPVPIQIDFYEATGFANIALYAANTTGAGTYSLIPADWLRPSDPVLPRGWSMDALAGFSAEYMKATVSTNELTVTRTDGSTVVYTKDATVANGWKPPVGEDDQVTVRVNGTVQVTATDGTVYSFRSDGVVDTITDPSDSGKPTAPTPTWTPLVAASPSLGSRLTAQTDPVSGKQLTYVYSGGIGGACPAVPAGGFAIPTVTGMLCQVSRPDGQSTKLFYKSDTNQIVLSRIENPGGEITDLTWVNGNLTQVRSPLAYDAIASGLVADTSDYQWLISYDTSLPPRVVGIQAPLPTPTTPAAARPGIAIDYTSQITSQVRVASLSGTPTDWDRKVTFDGSARWLIDQQATNAGPTTFVEKTAGWGDPDDLLLYSKANGRYTVNKYEAHGWLTDTWGPAQQDGTVNCFTTTATPTAQSPYPLSNAANCPATAVPHSQTWYDTTPGAAAPGAPMAGLAATYWSTPDSSGAPSAMSTAVTSGLFAQSWGAGAPAGVTAVDNWSARYSGEINLPVAGAAGGWGFWITTADASDKAAVYIDDVPAITLQAGAFWAAGQYVSFGTVPNALAAGVHRIRVEYRAGTGNAYLQLNWNSPAAGNQVVAATALAPRYGLPTRTQTDDSGGSAPSSVTETRYDENGWDPAYGLPTSTTVDPGGLALKTSTNYETTLRRRSSRTLPGGTTNTYAYYGNTATNPAISCADGTTIAAGTANQAGLAQTATSPAPASGAALVNETVYDNLGRPLASRVGTDPYACTSYDARGRVTKVSYPAIGAAAARTVTNTYGTDPRIVTTNDPQGTITSIVDFLGRTRSYTDVWGNNTDTVYDQAGRVTDVSTVATTHYNLDRAGRTTSQVVNGVTVATPAYTAGANGGELTTATFSNGTSLDPIGRDVTGAATALAWKNGTAALASNAVKRSKAGRVIDEATNGTIGGVGDPNTAGDNYTYDAAGRLTNAVTPAGNTAYDYSTPTGCAAGANTNANKNSNRTKVVTGGVLTASNCYDNADRLISTTQAGYTGAITYDSHGNATASGGSTFAYDQANRHTTTISGTTTVSYVRDATDRIVSRTETTATAGGPAVLARTNVGSWGTQSYYNTIDFVSGSFTPPANTLLVVAVTDEISLGTTTPPITLTNSAGLTFTKRAERQEPATWSQGVAIFTAPVGASPVPMTITVSNGATLVTAGWQIHAVAYSGYDLASPVGATGAASALVTNAPFTLTLSGTTAAASETFAALGGDEDPITGSPVTPGAGWTEDYESVSSDPNLQTQQHPGATSTVVWATIGSPGVYKAVTAAIEIRAANVGGGIASSTVRYTYNGPGDGAVATLDASNNIVERNFALPGGVMLTKRVGNDIWSYPNIHGDVIATYNTTGSVVTVLGGYDAYGNASGATPDNSAGKFDYGWLGQHQRGTDTTFNPTIEMGARIYNPTLGRFLQVDPIEGGTGTNDYGYVGDSVNRFDLDGRGGFGGGCSAGSKKKKCRHSKYAAEGSGGISISLCILFCLNVGMYGLHPFVQVGGAGFGFSANLHSLSKGPCKQKGWAWGLSGAAGYGGGLSYNYKSRNTPAVAPWKGIDGSNLNLSASIGYKTMFTLPTSPVSGGNSYTWVFGC